MLSISLRAVATGKWARDDTGSENLPHELLRSAVGRSAMIAIILSLGLGVGALVGLLGIGGGVVLVPAMVYLLGMDQHVAQGTSLFILLPPVGLGALREYWRAGQVDLRAGILCAAGMLAGGYVGGLVALPLSSRELKGWFGCFLMVAAAVLWWRSGRNVTAGPVEGQEATRG